MIFQNQIFFRERIVLNESQSTFNWLISNIKRQFISNYYKYLQYIPSFHFAKNYKYRGEEKHVHRNVSRASSRFLLVALFHATETKKERREESLLFSLGRRFKRILASREYARQRGTNWVALTNSDLAAAISYNKAYIKRYLPPTHGFDIDTIRIGDLV